MKVVTPEGYTFVTKFQEDNSHKVLRSVDFFLIKFDEIFFDTVCWVAAFVVANVRDNVRLQYLQDCCYYGIQEKGNCSRGCILMRERFIFGGCGRGKVGTSIVGIFGR